MIAALYCLVAFAIEASTLSGKAQGLPALEQTQNPVSNLHRDWTSNAPNQARAMAGDNWASGGQIVGAEQIGNKQGTPPHHFDQNPSAPIQSGGPQVWCQTNTSVEQETPGCGLVTGGTTRCAIQSALGNQVNEKPYLHQQPEVLNYSNPIHNQSALANLMAQGGLGMTHSPGQSLSAPSVMNSQTVPNASQSAAISSEAASEFVQKMTDPQGWANVAKAMQEFQNAQNSDNQANACKQNCNSAFNNMLTPLTNVANEDAAAQTSSSAAYKTEANAIWMVQQLYKHCYLPMALLFLLPGAIITQTKSLVSFGFAGTDQDEDKASPFAGLLRSIIAIFLIPATQLVVSYCIDIGNSLSSSVAQPIHVQTLMNWVNEQAYASDPKNNDNTIKNVPANMGKLAGTPSTEVIQERQNDLCITVQNASNTVNNYMSQGLQVLNAFQLVLMCYLFLLGPIAAAFFAWPSGIGNSLFKKAFSSWLNGVVVLSLWKFWWCIVLLCMQVRLQAGNIDSNSQYEMYYFTAFMCILLYIPFQPFNFQPGGMIESLLGSAMGAGTGGAGGATSLRSSGFGGGSGSASNSKAGTGTSTRKAHSRAR